MQTLQKPEVHPRPSPNKSNRQGARIDVILLHHTAGRRGDADLAWLCNGASKVSAHYLVDRDGKVYQLVPDREAAWHAGPCQLYGKPTNMNSRSIGIELANLGDGKEPYTEAQYLALEALVPYLVQLYQVPLVNLLGHKDVAIPKGRKTDPSPNFDFERVRKAAARVAPKSQ